MFNYYCCCSFSFTYSDLMHLFFFTMCVLTSKSLGCFFADAKSCFSGIHPYSSVIPCWIIFVCVNVIVDLR